jgi:alkylation response protein AidB-like acyl-CoA dehydrogenase
VSTLSSADILANARALVPEISARASEAARARRVLPDLAEKLRAAGVFRVMFPKALGGPEMPLPQQIELIETLSYADASLGWAAKINFDSGYFAAALGETAARELYPSIDFATAGQAPPNGRAQRVSGGFRVTGRWGFASGCNHADVLLAGCLILDREDATPNGAALVFAPASCWTIEDTWYSNGLAGSGSHHYSTQDLFVPDHHVLVLGSNIGRRKFDGPLYAAEPGVTIVIPMIGVPLGLMRRAIDEALKFIGGRVIAATSRERPVPMADLARVKLAVARAQMMFGAARAYAYETIGRYWDETVTKGACALETRREVGMARLHALRTAREVTQLMFDTIGAPAVYETLPFGSLLRDAVVINQHRIFSDDVLERLGGVMMGGSPDGIFI